MSSLLCPWTPAADNRSQVYRAMLSLSRRCRAATSSREPSKRMTGWECGFGRRGWGFKGNLFIAAAVASSASVGAAFGRVASSGESSNSMYAWPDKKKPRVCILGGGFGGLYTALRLESLIWPDENKPQVVLVDQSERFVFKPMLYELLSGEVDPWEIAPPFTELLRNTSVQFIKDRVKVLRPTDHLNHFLNNGTTSPNSGGTVYLESGLVVEYDWLVLALGAEAKLDAVPGSAEYAFPFSTLKDALDVDGELKMLERRRFGMHGPPIRVVVVGCGYSGVELAATISERLQNKGTVQAINVNTTICPNASTGNREAALKVLQSRGIELFLGYYVRCIKEVPASESTAAAKTGSSATTDSHKKLILELQPSQKGLRSQFLEADMVLWTVGSISSIPLLQPSDDPFAIPMNGRGQVETDEMLRVRGHPRTFAIGDSTTLRDPSGNLLPATAQVALQQADFTGWNLWAAINKRPLLPFRFQNLGEMMTLGKNGAAITPGFVDGFTLDGPLAHAARKFVYLLRMPTDEHRLKVGFSWLAKTAIDSAAALQTAVSNVLAGP